MKFQGTIKTKENSRDSFELLQDNSENAKEDNKKEKSKEVPFKLNDNDAVISYVENGAKKYFKITLVK
tara:strand:- start:618 stop:821 length:204 start_codon:yes stop_codon:yes gene_type:complete